MASPLVQQAFTVNELASKYLGYPKFILFWDSKTQTFKSHTKWSMWYFTAGFIMFFLFFISMLTAYIMNKLQKPSFKIILEHQAILTLYIFDWSFACALNLSIYWCVDGIAAYINLLLAYQSTYFDRRVNSKVNFKMRNEEFIKALKGQKCETIGLLVLYVAESLSTTPILSAVILYFAKLDPFFIAVLYGVPRSYLFVTEYSWFPLITCFIFLIFVMEICRTARVLIIAIIAITQMTIHCLNDILRILDRSIVKSINSYQLLSIAHIHHIVCANTFAVAMGFGYFIAVVAGAISLIGLEILPIILYPLYLITWLVASITMLVAIPYAATSYELSKSLIREWKYRLSGYYGPNKKYYRAKVNSFREIGFMCGWIGKLCKKSKTIYLSSLLCDTSTALLMFKSV
ncbi:unnamed protein product [Orchesella dallaii]|uniref:Odorant receptor n=1 Tax=Orchesella dallaii TaxID=48710 RepID=A0ABP1RD71_9HEXA